ncbi:MAG: ribosome maturation factor RimP [Meiothermus sp.]|uniref:ribosome maturation factor RimP n=1 Tax=Meiothermus sp. TaxID=1955249 RepID=UPI0025D0C82B|nr:ribosome maturation factor RimP [Meiothermus sp.]MCS7067334.1 ribosome maturation factor RimP [Meiothermus sp.]MDW8424586.1 ribosome maturation factor RimP [Meiothermus sp.]
MGSGLPLWDKLAESVLSPLGYDVLEASLKGGKSRVLLVRLERKDEAPITVSDLERANRALGAELDRLEALLPERYLLQVESPGADRPLFTARHFERFVGLKVRVRSTDGSFTGRVGPVRGDTVEFVLEKGEIRTLKLGTFKAQLAEWPDKPR